MAAARGSPEPTQQQSSHTKREFEDYEWDLWCDLPGNFVADRSQRGDDNGELHLNLRAQSLDDSSLENLVKGVFMRKPERVRRITELMLGKNEFTSDGLCSFARGLDNGGVKLRLLDLGNNPNLDSLVSLIEAETGLSSLVQLNCGGCPIKSFPPKLCWLLPSLREMSLASIKRVFTFPPDLVMLPANCLVGLARTRGAQVARPKDDGSGEFDMVDLPPEFFEAKPKTVGDIVAFAGLRAHHVSRPGKRSSMGNRTPR